MVNWRLVTVVIGVTVFLPAASAQAATISDLQAIGFTVSVSYPGSVPGCPFYYVSGFGNSSYFLLCSSPPADPNVAYSSQEGQALIDSWASPESYCDVKWQYFHPDQVRPALDTLPSLGYTVVGDNTGALPCNDMFTVTDANGKTVYSGSGTALPGLASTLPVSVLTATTATTTTRATTATATTTPTTTTTTTESATPTPTNTPTPSTTAPNQVSGSQSATAETSTLTTKQTTTVSGHDAAARPTGIQYGIDRRVEAVLSHAVAERVVLTRSTRCLLAGKRTSCATIAPLLIHQKVTLTGTFSSAGFTIGSLSLKG